MAVNSINSNAVALQVLSDLNAAGDEVGKAQQRISTGLRVSSAKDDGAIWSIAQTLRTGISDWNAVAGSLTRAQSTVQVASAATASITDLLQQLKAKAVSYDDSSLDASSEQVLQADMKALVAQIDQQAKGADFNGLNLLTGDVDHGVVARTSSTLYSWSPTADTPLSFLTPMTNTKQQTGAADPSMTATSTVQSPAGMVNTTGYDYAYSPLTPASFAQLQMSSLSSGATSVRFPSVAMGPFQWDQAALPTLPPPAPPPPTSARMDVLLDGFNTAQDFEIWSNGTRVAASGQPLGAQGSQVAPGIAQSGRQALSFLYDPSQPLNFTVTAPTGDPYAVIDMDSTSPGAPVPGFPGSYSTTIRSTSDPSNLPGATLNFETAGAAPTNGQASYTVDPGPNAGRVDLQFDAGNSPDTVDVYQNGVRVAASGQAYAPGGGGVAGGQPVTGRNAVSFDYNPADGPITFKFNENDPDPSAGWAVTGLSLQPSGAPMPTNASVTAMTPIDQTVQTTETSEDDMSGLPAISADSGSPDADAPAAYTIDGGPNAGRVDLTFDAYTDANQLEIFQDGALMAATNVAYSPGGAAITDPTVLANIHPVPGANTLSFDYDPANGRDLTFVVDGGVSSANAWTIANMTLQDTAAPLPSVSASTVQASGTGPVYPDIYALADSPKGTPMATLRARNLTSAGLGLDSLNWGNPDAILQTVSSALDTTLDTATYLGRQSQRLDGELQQNSVLTNNLQKGVSDLVDADMTQESAKLQAAQSKQQLAAKALAIANAAPQWILSLFTNRAG